MFAISDIKDQFLKQKINKARKLTVREFEEEKKNHFVCFIDDKDTSYDVQMVIANTHEITTSSCDCGEEDFCLHKIALAIRISEQNSGKPQKISKGKKISEAELAMENLNSEELKYWILEFFKKNKEAEVQFLLEFGEKKTDFSNEEIAEIIKTSFYSVIGKKKNITAPEIKKVTDLLAKSLEPVEEFLWRNITNSSALEKWIFIYKEILGYQGKIYTTSTRIDRFLEKLKEKFALHFNGIQDIRLWEKLAKDSWDTFLKNKRDNPYYIYFFLLEMYHAGNPAQKKLIAGWIASEIDVWLKNGVNLQVQIREDMLDIIIENSLFSSYCKFFPIARYENSYNYKVINETLKTDPARAEEMCELIIENNSNIKYSYPYFEILEKIYIRENDVQKLAFIKIKKFDMDPNLEDFIFIEKHADDQEEFKKFRAKILANLRRSFYSSIENIELYFSILDHEQNYKKMIDVIDQNIPASILNKFAEKLYLTDKNRFLSKLNRRISWNNTREDETLLAGFLVAKYDPSILKKHFSKNFFSFEMDRFASLVLSMIQ